MENNISLKDLMVSLKKFYLLYSCLLRIYFYAYIIEIYAMSFSENMYLEYKVFQFNLLKRLALKKILYMIITIL